MIFDCFLYNGEEELLQIRMEELSLCNQSVTHVLIEANKTHTGWDKKVYSKEISFDVPYNLIVLTVEDLPISGTPMDREVYQRNKISFVLKQLEIEDDDIVIISDVDEVPRAKQINKFKPEMKFASLLFDKYAYYLNCLESKQSWDRARICTWKYLKDKTPDEVRNSGYDFTINDAGWHWSWVIDPIRKLESFSHQELNTQENMERIEKKENIWNKDDLKIIDIDLSHPRFLFENKEKYSHLIFKK